MFGLWLRISGTEIDLDFKWLNAFVYKKYKIKVKMKIKRGRHLKKRERRKYYAYSKRLIAFVSTWNYSNRKEIHLSKWELEFLRQPRQQNRGKRCGFDLCQLTKPRKCIIRGESERSLPWKFHTKWRDAIEKHVQCNHTAAASRQSMLRTVG